MINIEEELFTKIATALRSQFSGIYVSGEYVNQPSSFPAVFIIEMDNKANRRTRSSSSNENYADVMYQVDVYSNKTKGRKAEAKQIMAAVDEQFAAMGFTRSYLNPVPNMNDATIYRMTGRWIATVSPQGVVYWR